MKVKTGEVGWIICDENLRSMKELLSYEEFEHTKRDWQALTLSFNRISNMQNLDLISSKITDLNVSHNELRSLEGIEGQTELEVLKATHNSISSVLPLQTCAKLQELWITDNQIQLQELYQLSKLSNLRILLIQRNPCCNLPTYKLFIVGLMPHLERLDTTLVTDDMRTRANDFLSSEEGRELLELANVPLILKTKSSSRSLSIQKPPPKASHSNITNTHDQAALRSEAESLTQILNENKKCSETEATPKPRRLVQEKDFFDINDFPIQEFIPVSNDEPLKTFENFPEADILVDEARDDSTQSESTLTKVEESRKVRDDKIIRKSSLIMDSVGGLPTFDQAPKRKSSMKTKKKTQRKASKPIPESYTAPNDNEQEFISQYGSQGNIAIHIQKNGSAMAKWSNGTIAVTVDKEAVGYRIYASHRDGKIAVCIDSSGVGCANYYPSGKTLMSSNSDGGMILSEKGSIELTWDKEGNLNDTSGKTVAEVDPALGISLYNQKLSTHMGLQLYLRKNAYEVYQVFAEVYISDKAIQQKFVQGMNAAISNSSECHTMFGNTRSMQRHSTPPTAAEPFESHDALLQSIRSAIAGL